MLFSVRWLTRQRTFWIYDSIDLARLRDLLMAIRILQKDRMETKILALTSRDAYSDLFSILKEEGSMNGKWFGAILSFVLLWNCASMTQNSSSHQTKARNLNLYERAGPYILGLY